MTTISISTQDLIERAIQMGKDSFSSGLDKSFFNDEFAKSIDVRLEWQTLDEDTRAFFTKWFETGLYFARADSMGTAHILFESCFNFGVESAHRSQTIIPYKDEILKLTKQILWDDLPKELEDLCKQWFTRGLMSEKYRLNIPIPKK